MLDAFATSGTSPPKTMNLRRAAQHFGVSRYVLADAVRKGALPAYRTGSRNLTLYLDDVDAWIRSKRVVIDADDECLADLKDKIRPARTNRT